MHRTDRSRRLALAGAIAGFLTFTAPVEAAELRPDADAQWGGFYIGAQMGGAWSKTNWRYDNLNYFNTDGPTLVGRDFSFDAASALGGGQLGFNYQTGAWVLGVEGAATAAELDAHERSPFFPLIDVYKTDLHWLTSVTGRVGFSQGSWLAYAKGGWAGADVGLDLHNRFNQTRAAGDSWTNGWTVGGGAEYALWWHVSLGIEYGFTSLNVDHWNVRCSRCGGAPDVATPIVEGGPDIQSVTARLNYRFGG